MDEFVGGFIVWLFFHSMISLSSDRMMDSRLSRPRAGPDDFRWDSSRVILLFYILFPILFRRGWYFETLIFLINIETVLLSLNDRF